MKRRQTSLPTENSQALTDEPSSALGLPSQRPGGLPPKQSKHPPRVITRPHHVFYSSVLTVNSEARQILGESVVRRYLLIQNVGGPTVFLGFGVTATIDGTTPLNTIELPAGSSIELQDGIVPMNDITALTAAGLTGRLSILEGNEV